MSTADVDKMMTTTATDESARSSNGNGTHTPESLEFEQVAHTPDGTTDSHASSPEDNDDDVSDRNERIYPADDKDSNESFLPPHVTEAEDTPPPRRLPSSSLSEADDPAASFVNVALRDSFVRETPPLQPQFPNVSSRQSSPFTPLRRVRKERLPNPPSALSSTFTAASPMPPSPMPPSPIARTPSIEEQLVMLHCSLLPPSPGEVSSSLKHPFTTLSSTLSSRGLLLPHPHSNFEKLVGDLREELGVGDAWDIVIYAANGMMTRGAWERVWEQMERVDVEVLPRDKKKKKDKGMVKYSRGANEGTPTTGGMSFEDETARLGEGMNMDDDTREGFERESTPVPYAFSESEFPSTPAPPLSPSPTPPDSPRARSPSDESPSKESEPASPSAANMTEGVGPDTNKPVHIRDIIAAIPKPPAIVIHIVLSVLISLTLMRIHPIFAPPAQLPAHLAFDPYSHRKSDAHHHRDSKYCVDTAPPAHDPHNAGHAHASTAHADESSNAVKMREYERLLAGRTYDGSHEDKANAQRMKNIWDEVYGVGVAMNDGSSSHVDTDEGNVAGGESGREEGEDEDASAGEGDSLVDRLWKRDWVDRSSDGLGEEEGKDCPGCSKKARRKLKKLWKKGKM